jgi:excisionase family DNA binding protein
MSDDVKLMNVKDVAAWLGLSVHAIYRKVQLKEIPHIRIGERTVRFNRSKVEAWLKQLEQ